MTTIARKKDVWRGAIAGHGFAKFKNDRGVPEIRIGVKEFECIGVSPPGDHPHVYVEIGERATILCPYCATLFRFDPRLGPGEADPPDCLCPDDLGSHNQDPVRHRTI